ncbi:MAG: DUF3467 domain-containing protein [Candidatus Eisenbacteria bacterium]|nr:DUF3467 domain-containing protein [Candidatus Eisenbacteria bacterium]
MESQGPQQQKQQLNVELGDKEAEGIYSNFVLLSHGPSEVILDFARMLPGLRKAKVFSRIVMTPPNAKMLLETLERNIKSYEEKHGKIKTQGKDDANKLGF